MAKKPGGFAAPAAKERRKAKKRVRQAFKKARKRGELPDDAELAAAVHGDRRGKKHGGPQPVVVVVGQDGRRAMVHVDPRAFGFEADEIQRELHEAERLLRQEQRRLERRARAIEQLLEEERRRGEGGESFMPPGLQRKLQKMHKHEHKHKHKPVPPGRARGWGHVAAPPHPPAAAAPPRPPTPPRAATPPTPPRAPTPPGLTPVLFD